MIWRLALAYHVIRGRVVTASWSWPDGVTLTILDRRSMRAANHITKKDLGR